MRGQRRPACPLQFAVKVLIDPAAVNPSNRKENRAGVTARTPKESSF